MELTILKEKVRVLEESRRDQIGRIESHFESERRHRDALRDKLNSIEKAVDKNQDEIKNHREILYNKGTGLLFAVREMATKMAQTDNVMDKVLKYGSIVISALALYFSYK